MPNELTMVKVELKTLAQKVDDEHANSLALKGEAESFYTFANESRAKLAKLAQNPFYLG